MVTGLKHQKARSSGWTISACTDVSVKETSVCIVDDTGKIVREAKVSSEPDALLAVLANPAYCFERIGLEAGPLSQWLFSALAEAGLPVICVETRHMRAAFKARINKTDRNDARGIAQMMRAGLYRPVHVKTLRSQKLRMLLTHRPPDVPAAPAHRHPTKLLDRCRVRSARRVIPRENDRHFFLQEPAGMMLQAEEPGELVIEFRAGLRVSVREINAADQHAADSSFQIAALRIGSIARQGLRATTGSAPRERIATPFHVFCPIQTA